MDRDTIIRLAREAELWEMLEGYSSEYASGDAERDCLPDLERFAALVAAHERKQALAEPDSDYERGFVDGMQEQMKRSVDKAVNRMAQTTHWEGCDAVHPECRKPEQEPVAWMLITPYGEEDDIVYTEPEIVPDGWSYKPLYDTAPTPRQWVSLTEQEMYDLFFHDQYGPRLPEYLVNTIKCIEAALKEKNSGS